jgi:hypothetical protein
MFASVVQTFMSDVKRVRHIPPAGGNIAPKTTAQHREA